MKKYVVRLTDEERKICKDTINRLTGSSQKARRARILLQVDADGPAWVDRRVAEAFRCRVKTVENVRRRVRAGGLPAGTVRPAAQRPAGAEAAGWRAGDPVDRVAAGAATARLRELVAAAAGAASGRTGDGRLDQPRDREANYASATAAESRYCLQQARLPIVVECPQLRRHSSRRSSLAETDAGGEFDQCRTAAVRDRQPAQPLVLHSASLWRQLRDGNGGRAHRRAE